MPNHKSAIKRNRQSIKRRARNRTVRSSIRTAMKAVRTKVEGGDLAGAQALLRSTEASLARAAVRGLIHPRNASRKISQLASFVARAGK